MFIIYDFESEVLKYGLTLDRYEKVLTEIDKKLNNETDLDWSEIKDKYGIDCNPDTIRKGSTTIFGGKFRTEYEKSKQRSMSVADELDIKLAEIKKEKMKLQTLNIERTRLDRNQARQELYYEYIGNTCEALPLPHFEPIYLSKEGKGEMHYVAEISDIHYGAEFTSMNNIYSKEIAVYRLQLFLGHMIDFVKEHKLNKISLVCLGDTLQGLLRVNDLKINDSSVVKSTVEIARIIAKLINELSAYCYVDYYHVPTANHTQTRPLGSKASELADEDLEYVVGHYIQDLCIMNDRITVHLAEDNQQYIHIEVPFNTVVAGHGHTIKNTRTAIRDLSMLMQEDIDYLLLGHFHGGNNFSVNEGTSNDYEVIVAPSIVGSDPYSDSIMKGSKAAAKIYGFNETYGLTEQYKYVLN